MTVTPCRLKNIIRNRASRLAQMADSDEEVEANERHLIASDFDAFAEKLLKNQLLLTALELHTELVEAGLEIPRLRDFFSNPGNFERQFLSSSRDALFPGLREYLIYSALRFVCLMMLNVFIFLFFGGDKTIFFFCESSVNYGRKINANRKQHN